MVLIWVALAVILLYIAFDVNYFLRILFTVGICKMFEKKKKILDTTTIYGVCTTQDVDLFFKHMNNARYLRELDFARFHYYDRSGIYAAIAKRGGGAVQAACSTRYRRAIPIFKPYKINSKVLYWEDKSVYMEHQYISMTDNFVHAVILSKQTMTGIDAPISEIIEEVDPEAECPEMQDDLKFWIDSMEESSQKYRKQD